MKKFFLIVFMMFFCGTLWAQEDTSGMKKKERFIDKLSFGGGFSIGFGTETFILAQPRVGYKLTEDLTAGVGAYYLYYRFKTPSIAFQRNFYGGSVFANYKIFDNLFAHGEIELVNVEYYDFEANEYLRTWVEGVFVGGGYRYPLGGRVVLELMALYNLTYYPVISPYGSPFQIRVGVMVR